MDTATRNYINSLAQNIINFYNITIPITNIESVVKLIGGEIEEKFNFDDMCDGSISKYGINSFRIIISPYQNNERKSFTIAHELGHLFLHMGYMTNDSVWQTQYQAVYRRFGATEQEYQANEFAAALLMPINNYRQIIDKYSIGNQVNIAEVAKYFKVSISAATNRGRFLGYLA